MGRAPEILAGICGAQKNETYTIALEFTGVLVKHFPGQIRLERRMRVAVPLTIKRAPSRCGWENEMLASPRVTGGPLADWTRVVGPAGLASRSLGRSSVFAQGRPSRQRAIFGTVRSPPKKDKENCGWSHEEVHKLLERKAAEPVDPTASPTRLSNPLSLARFHDAIQFRQPPPELRNVEVRTAQMSSRHSSPHVSPFSSPLRSAEKSSLRYSHRSPLANIFNPQRPEQARSPKTPSGSPSKSPRRPKHDALPFIPIHFWDEVFAESSQASQRRQGASCGRSSAGAQDCQASSSEPSSQERFFEHAAFDGAQDRSSDRAKPAERADPNGGPPFVDFNNPFCDSGRSLRHGPFEGWSQIGFEKQKRLIEGKFAKQAGDYRNQSHRAQRYGRSLDVDTAAGRNHRIDELDPRNDGAKDMQAKLKEWEAERLARQIAELSANVEEAEEKKSLFGLVGEDYALGFAAERSMLEDVKFDAERWQKTIQANHRELNEGKGKERDGKGRRDCGEGEGYKERLDITMLDLADSDESGGFSEEGEDSVVEGEAE